ncbi:hypothetical protein H072_8875 [Dactylellina haptotyla CBS 200.50]|uniref:ER membrane protein complex subunit 4 n=1 Tax=Dactylellina haptotyla (strain CBS 200.50) TaxID=1284197 RepID=S8A356_DACHA|nr:hypothetical protein H072_8875 [Dactylellina haptotyla CBS 200.50]
MAPSQPSWVIDLKGSAGRPKAPSNIKSSKQVTPPTQAETDDLKVKKAWEIALAPAKSLPMNMIMMYMSGNSLQIFSIMMTVMLFMNPLRALSTVGNTFSKFEGESTSGRLAIVKLAYIGLQLLTIVIGIWKVNAMGLLPTTRSDWLAWEQAPMPLETSISNFR